MWPPAKIYILLVVLKVSIVIILLSFLSPIKWEVVHKKTCDLIEESKDIYLVEQKEIVWMRFEEQCFCFESLFVNKSKK